MLKVGLIVDDGVVNELVCDLIEKSKNSSNYEVTTFVVQSNRAQNGSLFKRAIQYIKQKGIKKFISRISWALVCRIDQLALKKSEKFKNHTRNYHLDNIEIPKIYVNLMNLLFSLKSECNSIFIHTDQKTSESNF